MITLLVIKPRVVILSAGRDKKEETAKKDGLVETSAFHYAGVRFAVAPSHPA
jgi:hypothetical protein